MALDRCVFAARVLDTAHRLELETRVERLVEFYRALGDPRLSTRWLDRLDAVVGVIDFGARPHELDRPLTWGGSLPPELAGAEALLSAPGAQLRALDRVIGAIAASDDELCVIEGAGTGFPVFHEARSSFAETWSRHAVAAGWLAYGSVTIDPDAVVELVGYNFVGGNRSMVRDVTVLDSSTRIRVDGNGSTHEVWWPPPERWALVPEDDAYAHTEAALLESLGRRITKEPVLLGLTAGLDSRVAAVALQVLGIPFEAVTVGAPGHVDVDGAAVVAAALGIHHRVIPIEPTQSSSPSAAADAQARWNDGSGRATAVRSGASDLGAVTFVTGGGGETGRCLLYRLTARNYHHPTQAQLAKLATPTARMEAARSEAVGVVQRCSQQAVARAYGLGLQGWHALDVVAADERERRVYRALSTPGSSEFVEAFCIPDIQRGLTSLSLAERLNDGFHRRFIERHAPAVAPAPGPSQRPGLPPIARRLASVLRRHSRREEPGPRVAVPAELREWLGQVLSSALLIDPLGPAWAKRVGEAMAAGDPEGLETALIATGPVALQRALEQAGFA
ncbi:MAG TPA: hypothetical protein VGH24_04505 [Solirubrobacteraceae bacterium]